MKDESNKAHACGVALKKRNAVNDPFCYQLGFFDAYDQLEERLKDCEQLLQWQITEKKEQIKVSVDYAKQIDTLTEQNKVLISLAEQYIRLRKYGQRSDFNKLEIDFREALKDKGES